jgi:hypothetical protein
MLPRGNAFLAGCDGSVPGFCLHDELQIVTEAGLSPLQAIQTATINPARLLGREAFARPVAPVGDVILVTARSALRMANVRRVAESGVQRTVGCSRIVSPLLRWCPSSMVGEPALVWASPEVSFCVYSRLGRHQSGGRSSTGKACQIDRESLPCGI